MEEKILTILQDIQVKVNSMENKMGSMENRMDSMENKINSMDTEVKGIKVQLDEHGHILRALEHAVSVSQAKQDAMEHDIAHIKGDVTAIKDNLCFVEQATARNWQEIATLKAIK